MTALTDHARRRMIAPLIVGAAAFMQAFDSSAITVALPPMAAAFGVPALSLNLVITAYLIGATAFLPVCGWAADRFGARRVFLVAIAGFGLSSLACALATSLPWLIAARTFEGCMGALLLPVGRIIVLRSVPRNEFVAAISLLTMPIMLGPLLGPPIGGVIVTLGSWRWLFVVNMVVAVAGLFAVRRFVADLPGEDRRPLDLKGLALIVSALVGVTYGVSTAARDGADLLVIGGLIAGGFVCAALYWLHCRRHPAPILDLRVLHIPTVAVTNIGGLFPRLIVSAAPFLLALLFQLGFGLSAAATGGLIFASALGAVLGRWLLTPVVTRFGFRQFLIVNGVLLALSIAACAWFRPETPYAVIAAVLFTQGLLRALQLIGLMTLSYADLPDSEVGSASTIASVSQQFALSLGIVVSVFALQTAQHMRGETLLSIGAIAPAFLVIAGVSLLSLLWVWRLPDSAGRNLVGNTAPAAAESEVA